MSDVLLRVLAEPVPQPAPQPAPAVVAAAPPSRPLISTFLQMRPPEFRGDSGDPLRAEQFLVEVERIFVCLAPLITDPERVAFASHMLKEDAHRWWRTEQSLHPAGIVFTYEQFRTAFLARYFPERHHG